MLGFLLGGPEVQGLEARVARLERLVDRLLEASGVELPRHPATDEIDALVAAGKKIEAIKVYRQATGAGLAEAKRAIDAGTWARELSTHAM
jgi:hypothetical protein